MMRKTSVVEPALLEANAEFQKRIGADVKKMREAMGLTLEELGGFLSEGRYRTYVWRIESGERPIAMIDYLRIVHLARDLFPDHPALPLAKMVPSWVRTTKKPATLKAK